MRIDLRSLEAAGWDVEVNLDEKFIEINGSRPFPMTEELFDLINTASGKEVASAVIETILNEIHAATVWRDIRRG